MNGNPNIAIQGHQNYIFRGQNGKIRTSNPTEGYFTFVLNNDESPRTVVLVASRGYVDLRCALAQLCAAGRTACTQSKRAPRALRIYRVSAVSGEKL